MKFVEVIFDKLPEHPRPSKVVLEFVNSGKDCIEILYDTSEYVDAFSCVNSYRAAIERLRVKDSVVVHRWGERVFLIKYSDKNKVTGFLFAKDYPESYPKGTKLINWSDLFNEFALSGAAYKELHAPEEDPNRTAASLYSSASVYLRRLAQSDFDVIRIDYRAFIINKSKMPDLVEKYHVAANESRKAWREAILSDLRENIHVIGVDLARWQNERESR